MSKNSAVAVVFSDAHLAKRTWKHKPILGDSYFAFEQIVDYAIERELPLIGAGDLIDKRVNESSPIVFLQKQLKRLSQAGLRMFYTQGQHELDDVPWLSMGDAAQHIQSRVITLGGLQISGLDYQGSESLQQHLSKLPDSVNVLVCHQVWSDFMGDIALPQGSFADIPHATTVITGDFHQNVLATYHGAGGQDMTVFSPGATCMQSISEPDTHYFGVLWSDGTIRRKRLRSRKFDEFLLHNPEDVDELLGNLELYLEGAAEFAADNELPQLLHTPLWRITYSHRVSDVPRRLAKLVGDRAHLFWKELPQEREDSKVLQNLPKPEDGGAITMEMCLSEEIDPEEEPEAYALAARMLAAAGGNHEVEANRWLKEQLNAEH